MNNIHDERPPPPSRTDLEMHPWEPKQKRHSKMNPAVKSPTPHKVCRADRAAPRPSLQRRDSANTEAQNSVKCDVVGRRSISAMRCLKTTAMTAITQVKTRPYGLFILHEESHCNDKSDACAARRGTATPEKYEWTAGVMRVIRVTVERSARN